MPFDRDDILVRTRDGHHFVLVEPLTYTSKAGEAIVIPAGADTDGASTPHFLWPTIPPFGKYWKPAFLHDHLYRSDPKRRSREECDALLLEAMYSTDVDVFEARVIYDGVRTGGQAAFDEDRKKLGGIS